MYTFKAMAVKTYYHMYCNNKAPAPFTVGVAHPSLILSFYQQCSI